MLLAEKIQFIRDEISELTGEKVYVTLGLSFAEYWIAKAETKEEGMVSVSGSDPDTALNNLYDKVKEEGICTPLLKKH